MRCNTPNCHPSPPSKRPTEETDDHSQPLNKNLDEKLDKKPDKKENTAILPELVAVMVGLGITIKMLTSSLLGAPSEFTNLIQKGLSYMPFIILAIILLIVAIRNIVIVPQGRAYVVERLGKYKTTWHAGLHLKIPFIDRIANRISLKEQVMDFEPQSVITKDNVSMKIDTVVYLVVFDPRLATYGVEHVIPAIENLTATTLRNLIGELTLDETLTSRDTVNGQMQTLLDEATDPWGIKVNRVELKNIMPPRDIQEAMEKQMRAEREKREAILRAEGTKAARVLEATGVKEATILEAEAAKQRVILEAQAAREAAIARAEGEAQAIMKVKEAEAKGIEVIKAAGADDAVVRLKSLTTLENMAQGQATTLVIPSDLAGLAGNLAALKEAVKPK